MLISKLADPRVYLCDLANLGQLIEFLSAAEVQHCVLLSVPKHLLQFRNVILTLILLAWEHCLLLMAIAFLAQDPRSPVQPRQVWDTSWQQIQLPDGKQA